MEWAEDGTLEDMLKCSKTLSPKQSFEVTLQIADALEAIHHQDIVHRDIKPSNILMFSGNIAKLTDFGVAHVERAETLTGTGVQVGTLCYMSPEQYMAEDITPKTDIFALGLVLYEMLTGTIPFANPRELCQKDIRDIFNETQLPFSKEIAQLVIKCLENNASRRYNASELKHALQDMIKNL